MDHLALAVHDQERSRRFYERYLGFEAEAEPRSDGVLMLHARGFSLALGPTDEPISVPSFLHFGHGLDTPAEVRAFHDRLGAEGIEVVGWWDEPDYVSVKFRDPDGYVVEVGWEPRVSGRRTVGARALREDLGGSSAVRSEWPLPFRAR